MYEIYKEIWLEYVLRKRNNLRTGMNPYNQLPRGNFQNIESDDVVRKIRSEALSAKDYDTNYILDLMVDHQENDYGKYIGLPLYIQCYRREQL